MKLTKNYLAALIIGGIWMGVVFVGCMYLEGERLIKEEYSQLPPIEYDYEFFPELNRCKQMENLSNAECDVIFGLEPGELA